MSDTEVLNEAEARAWARQVISAQKRLKRIPPKEVELTASIVDLQVTDTIKGASVIEMHLADPTWELVTSGFLDADADGRLDPIDVNFPEGSDQWWRLTQVEFPEMNDQPVVCSFMERPATYLLLHTGPKKASRASQTRAEFMKSLVDEVKANGGLTFRCNELAKVQEIDPKARAANEKAEAKRLSEEKRKSEKKGGINKKKKLTVKTHPATSAQKKEAETVLDVCEKLNASSLATIATMCAAIGESELRPIRNQGHPPSPYWGVFQGNMGVFDIHDTAGMAKCFLLGGKGFQGGGAIKLAQQPGATAGSIALAVEGSRSNFPSQAAGELHYGQHQVEAKEFIEAYGGASGDLDGTGTSESYRKEYNFTVGSHENPKETYWDAMNRLADEVKWALFIVGKNVYYDSERTLIKQRPALIVERDDSSFVSFSGTWDDRGIATQAELTLICEPFEFRAGDVFELDGFGPFSTGSTAKLPGRWLIEEMDRSIFELATRFTLKQPEKPAPEPETEIGTRQTAESKGAGKLGDGSIRSKVVAIAKQSMSGPPGNTGYNYYSMTAPQTQNNRLLPDRGTRSDCSQWVHAVYLKAGLPSPGLDTYSQIAKGKRTSTPKPGDLMFEASKGHVELYIGGEGPPGKNTIGHGSEPIDYGDTSYWPGHFFVTYDFLDD